MYPGPEVLQEVGRVTIAGSRLDLQMGLLWHHLDRKTPFEETRRKGGGEQDRQVRKLAKVRLTGPLQDRVLAAATLADTARNRRNEIVHQDWLLRGREAMRPVSEWLALAPEDQAGYLEQWERESKDSEAWLRVPSRGTNVEDAQSLEDLIAVERALSEATDRVTELTYAVASSRETGTPPGYVHPPAAGVTSLKVV
jgi:hypothetical protein